MPAPRPSTAALGLIKRLFSLDPAWGGPADALEYKARAHAFAEQPPRKRNYRPSRAKSPCHHVQQLRKLSHAARPLELRC